MSAPRGGRPEGSVAGGSGGSAHPQRGCRRRHLPAKQQPRAERVLPLGPHGEGRRLGSRLEVTHGSNALALLLALASKGNDTVQQRSSCKA